MSNQDVFVSIVDTSAVHLFHSVCGIQVREQDINLTGFQHAVAAANVSQDVSDQSGCQCNSASPISSPTYVAVKKIVVGEHC